MVSELFKIMSDDTRLRIINLLYHHDLCVCEMVNIMEESQPKISKHIAKIRAQKLVNTNRNEQFIYYSLNRENELLVSLLETMKPQLESTLPFEEDLKRLSNLDGFVCSR